MQVWNNCLCTGVHVLLPVLLLSMLHVTSHPPPESVYIDLLLYFTGRILPLPVSEFQNSNACESILVVVKLSFPMKLSISCFHARHRVLDS